MEKPKKEMGLNDRFKTGKHQGRTLKTVLVCDILFVKNCIKRGWITVNNFVKKNYGL